MKFDYTLRADCGIEVGIVPGGSKIVFIKAGLGSSHFGDECKYLKSAHILREKYGCSVISVSNPHDGKSHAAFDNAIIREYVEKANIESPELYFLGTSNGAFKGLELSAFGVSFRRMLLVNMPLMINPHKINRYIASCRDTEITAVYGELDPSVKFIPFMEGKHENLRFVTVPRADHNFLGMTEQFLSLVDILMR